ncbi:MAG TPA: tetratricopeptide repeat protein, partial [Candidatus Polarisedimenticolaceae bacterium]|nr:tetratricopeptide repeat protein [Candidatus Polarisedimenticolaceae bacterium]
MILLLSWFVGAAEPPAGVALGWTLYRTGDFRGAAGAFAARLQEAPDDLDARTGLGFARLQSGELDAARADLEGVLSARPGDHDAIQGLGLLVARGGGPERRFRPDRGDARPDVPVRSLKDVFETRDGAGRF